MDTSSVLQDLFKNSFNVEISSFSDAFLAKILDGRMKYSGIGSLSEYLSVLKEDVEELETVYDSLFNSYTQFFRSPLTFSLLEQVVLPNMLMHKEKSDDPLLRIWSAGCSTGQEPYSVAFILADYFDRNNTSVNWRIFATDITLSLLEEAERGLFTLDQMSNIKISYLNHFFQKLGNHYIVREEIREKIFFSVYDLLDSRNISPPQSIFGDFDIILCSNVLLYYKDRIQQRLLEKFYRALNDQGCLIIGDEETGIMRNNTMFIPALSPAALYYKL